MKTIADRAGVTEREAMRVVDQLSLVLDEGNDVIVGWKGEPAIGDNIPPWFSKTLDTRWSPFGAHSVREDSKAICAVDPSLEIMHFLGESFGELHEALPNKKASPYQMMG